MYRKASATSPESTPSPVVWCGVVWWCAATVRGGMLVNQDGCVVCGLHVEGYRLGVYGWMCVCVDVPR